MKSTIKIATALSAVFVSSTALGVTGMDRLVFSPSFLFEKGNYAELTLARADPTVSTTDFPNANVAETVDTLKFAYKHQINDKFGLGLMVNTQPLGVDINYAPIGSTLRGDISTKSYIALGHYKATDRISVFGGANYLTAQGSADLTEATPRSIPGNSNFAKDTDTGFIVGAAYSIPKIALRASLSYESPMDFSLKTTNTTNPAINNFYAANGGISTAGTPEVFNLELQSGVAKDTLLFGSIRYSKWDSAQILLLGNPAGKLSGFSNATTFKLGVGRKFTDSISGSVTFNYEKSTGDPTSAFSPQDGEKGIALGAKFTAKDGFTTSLGVQYRKLGDNTIRPGPQGGSRIEDADVVTVGLKFSKSF